MGVEIFTIFSYDLSAVTVFAVSITKIYTQKQILVRIQGTLDLGTSDIFVDSFIFFVLKEGIHNYTNSIQWQNVCHSVVESRTNYLAIPVNS